MINTTTHLNESSMEYKTVLNIANKLENIILSVKSFEQIFNDEVIHLRQRLRDQCESLLISSPLVYGRRAENILWRRCYHDLMQYYKTNKKTITSDDKLLLQTHLTAGIGHYYNLLLIIAKHYGISLKKLIPYMAPVDDYAIARVVYDQHVMLWCNQTIHRILIYIGDLARYLYELEVCGYKDLSIRFYDSALIWNTSIGMPFNQLGTLSDFNNYGLDSVYYYMRCLTCEKPFDGADTNLRRVLDKNDDLLSYNFDQTTTDDGCNLVKQSILLFCKLCNNYWFMKETDFQLNKHILPLMQEVLYSFKSALNIKPTVSEETMNSLVVFEISVITMMLVTRIEDNKQISKTVESASLSSMVTFTVNFMMSLVECCQQNLKSKLGIDGYKLNDVLNFGQTLIKESTPELSPRRALSRLRRRKAAINYDDNNSHSLDGEDDDSDMSELEETALSTIDALEIGTDITDSNDDSDQENIDIGVLSSDEDNNSVEARRGEQNIDSSLLPIEELLNYILNESYLPTIKMYCDWLRSNPNILALSSSQLQVYFEEFVNFVNTLISIEEKALLSFTKLSEFKWFGANWVQTYPLSSDLSLSNIKCLKSTYAQMNFESQRVLNKVEKGFLCIQSILAFAHFLTDIKHNSNRSIAYNVNEKRFIFHGYSNGARLSLYDSNTWSNSDTNSIFLSNNSQTFINGHENSLNDSSNTADDSKRQKKFMRNMAHLWLKEEVSKLEKDVIGGSVPQLPPYIVLDSTVLCEHLDFIKKLAQSKRFILVIPKIVLSSLDQLKKTSCNARESIRWLEEELHRGNRVIKYTKDYEKTSLSPIKYPKRKDKEACDYYELLEYCNYFNKNTNSKNDDKKINGLPMVTLLTFTFEKWPSNAEAVAKTFGIHIETVDSFISKWQHFGKANT